MNLTMKAMTEHQTEIRNMLQHQKAASTPLQPTGAPPSHGTPASGGSGNRGAPLQSRAGVSGMFSAAGLCATSSSQGPSSLSGALPQHTTSANGVPFQAHSVAAPATSANGNGVPFQAHSVAAPQSSSGAHVQLPPQPAATPFGGVPPQHPQAVGGPTEPAAHKRVLNNGVIISEKVHSAAVNGEFVDLAEFLPNDSPMAGWSADAVGAHIEGNNIKLQAKKPRRGIHDFPGWLQAWNAYEMVLVENRPDIYRKLVCYRQFIQSCDQKYYWQAVSAYDVRFRATLAQSRSFEYANVDSSIFVTVLDATAVKRDARRCHRCRAYDHVVSDCPFPASSPLETGKAEKTQKKPSYEKWYHLSKEGCNNFNSGRCQNPQCQRAHVCKGCRGPEPQFRCTNCNKH